MSDPMERMMANYRRMVDDELLALAGQLDELTPEARTALWAELGRRGITDDAIQVGQPEAVESPSSPPDETPQWSLLPQNPPTLPEGEWVAVYSAETESEANSIRDLLYQSAIESQLQIVVLVRQEGAQAAFRVLSEELDTLNNPSAPSTPE
jgi:hypothetical protein